MLFACILLASGPARAQQLVSDNKPSAVGNASSPKMTPVALPRGTFTLRVRLHVPFVTVSLTPPSLDEPLGALVAGSLSAQIVKHIFVDLSSAGYFGVSKLPFDLHIRAGPGLDLLDRRDTTGKGWRMILTGLVGYRYLLRREELDGREGSETSHCLSFAGALEPEYMFTREMGLNLRVLVGLSVPVSQSRDGYWATNQNVWGSSDGRVMDATLDIVISIGLTIG